MKQFSLLPLICVFFIGCNEGSDEESHIEGKAVPSQEFGKRDWEAHPPTTEFEELALFHEGFQDSRYRAELKTELTLHDDKGRVVAILKPGLIIHSSGLDDADDTDLSDNFRNKILFDLPVGADIQILQEAAQESLGGSWFRHEAAVSGTDDSEQHGVE